MTVPFPLAGLLRLRRLEQDQAAGHLGAANSRFAALAATEARAAAEAEQLPSEASTSAALQAIAAARASSMSMLTELRGLAAVAGEDRDEAERVFGAARARTVGLEKLEARHAVAAAPAEIAAEQVVLDELGSAARLRAGHAGHGHRAAGPEGVGP